MLRAGDVIPQVVSPAPHVAEHADRPPPPRPPAALPVLRHPDRQARGPCSPSARTATARAAAGSCCKHFVSRGAMDIDGLGEKQVGAAAWSAAWCATAADFYDLTAEQLLELDGFGEISARKPARGDRGLQASGRSRASLFALGIEEVGEVTGRNLARSSATSTRCSPPTPEEIEQTPGRRAEDGADDPRPAGTSRAMRELIAELRDAGLRFDEEGPPPGRGPAGRA